MKLTQYILAGVSALVISFSAYSATLDDVRDRGVLNCIVSTGLPGFSNTDDSGRWQGFDVDLCRAVAAAVLGDSNKVKFIPATAKVRFTTLNSGEGDLLVRNTTWTLKRDVDKNLSFQGVNYYDGQGFIVRASSGVKSALELDGASICVQSGTTTEQNVASYFRFNGMKYETVVVEDDNEAAKGFFGGRCDAYTTDASALASTKAKVKSPEKPSDYRVLPEIISKEPLGPVTRQGDEAWGDIVRWTLNALITAEEFGVTSKNAKRMFKKSERAQSKGEESGIKPEIERLLGTSDDFGGMLGLSSDWALNVITQVGNYGEIFERNVGVKTALGLKRGTNALWTNGGLLYSPPFR